MGEWDFFWQQIVPALNRGLLVSTKLIIPSSVFGLLLGILVGTGRVFGKPRLRKLLDRYTALFRGVPLLVQLFIIYFGLPGIGIRLDGFTSAVLGFTLCSAAYHSEYIRGALSSIRQGQVKAAQSLGMTTLQGLAYIVIPQAMRRALPGCGNEIIYLIKYSSLAYIITCIELTGEAKVIASRTFRYTEVFMAVGVYYLFLTTATTWLLGKLEKRLAIPGFGSKG